MSVLTCATAINRENPNQKRISVHGLIFPQLISFYTYFWSLNTCTISSIKIVLIRYRWKNIAYMLKKTSHITLRLNDDKFSGEKKIKRANTLTRAGRQTVFGLFHLASICRLRMFDRNSVTHRNQSSRPPATNFVIAKDVYFGYRDQFTVICYGLRMVPAFHPWSRCSMAA